MNQLNSNPFITPNPLQKFGEGFQAAADIELEEKKKVLLNAGIIAGAARGVKTPEDFESVKKTLVDMGAVRADEASQYTFDRLPELQNMVRGLEGQISDERDLRDYQTGVSQWERQFGQRQQNSDRTFELNRLNQNQRNSPKPQSPSGKIAYDFGNGFIDETQRDTALGGLNKPADEYERFVQEERAAGRQPLSRIDFHKAKQKKSSITVGPDGTVRVVEGGTDQNGRIQPSSPTAMIDSIDKVLADPALDTATGVFSFLQNVPGTGAKRFGTRADQLQGQAFLQAFESLKGAGQITEIEGQKATQAVGRLDTAQSAEDYRQALTELREILIRAQAGVQPPQQDGSGFLPRAPQSPPGPQNPPGPQGGFGDLTSDQLREMLGQ